MKKCGMCGLKKPRVERYAFDYLDGDPPEVLDVCPDCLEELSVVWKQADGGVIPGQ